MLEKVVNYINESQIGFEVHGLPVYILLGGVLVLAGLRAYRYFTGV